MQYEIGAMQGEKVLRINMIIISVKRRVREYIYYDVTSEAKEI